MTFSKKLIKPAFILFLVLYFFYIVISRAPAEIAAAAIHKAAPNVWLTGLQGSLWHGVAKGSQVDIGSQTLSLGVLQWRLSFWSLLILKPCINFSAQGGSVLASGNVCQGLGGTSANDVSLDMPIAPLSEVLKLPVSGQGSLQVLSAKFKGTKINKLDGRISWQSASTNVDNSGWVNLGSYGANLKENGKGGVTAAIFDISGPIKTQLQADLNIGNWTIEGKVTPGEKAPELIKGGVQLIGEEIESGTYKIVWSGH